MTIDAVRYHLGSGYDTEGEAAWHIAVFLQWCARNGMLAPTHAAAAAIAGPIDFLLQRCGGKLCQGDLTAEGNRFAGRVYPEYLREVSLLHGDGDHWELLHEFLDREYAAQQTRRASAATAGEVTEAHPAKRPRK
jgi:hypothetical protein